MKKFEENVFVYLTIAHLFALGSLSSHILFSDW